MPEFGRLTIMTYFCLYFCYTVYEIAVSWPGGPWLTGKEEGSTAASRETWKQTCLVE